MLQVAEQLEHSECTRTMTQALARLGLSTKQLREIELAAFDWVRELSGAEASARESVGA
jgi:EAL and modified HD-GYP domain-containing signal transduction protein